MTTLLSWKIQKKVVQRISRLSQQDQFNQILLGKMTRMEAVMIALTKATASEPRRFLPSLPKSLRPATNFSEKGRKQRFGHGDQTHSRVKAYDLEASSLTSVKQQQGESLKKYIQRMIDVAAKIKVTDDMKMVALTSGLTIGSLLWGDLQRKRADTLSEFLIRAQGFINLEDAYAQAYKVLPAPSTEATNAQPSQMETPFIDPPPTAFTTPTVYGSSTSVQPVVQAGFSRFGPIQTGYIAAPGQMNQKAEAPESNVTHSRSKRSSNGPNLSESHKKGKDSRIKIPSTSLIDT
uniref:Uncharacterized protein n=1 Tax=Cannabis sativa TaxID=3483 RepID=A0A803PKG5_CANSA